MARLEGLTSNRSFVNWGRLFGDRVIPAGILDSLLRHGITVTIREDDDFLR
jgi:hypothetical protein